MCRRRSCLELHFVWIAQDSTLIARSRLFISAWESDILRGRGGEGERGRKREDECGGRRGGEEDSVELKGLE